MRKEGKTPPHSILKYCSNTFRPLQWLINAGEAGRGLARPPLSRHVQPPATSPQCPIPAPRHARTRQTGEPRPLTRARACAIQPSHPPNVGHPPTPFKKKKAPSGRMRTPPPRPRAPGRPLSGQVGVARGEGCWDGGGAAAALAG